MTSSHTVTTYARCLAQIKKGLGVESRFDDFTFLENHAAITAWIDGSAYAQNSKKTFYIAIVSKLKNICQVGDDKMSEASSVYRTKMDLLNKEASDKSKEQQLSPAELLKYMEWPQILETVEKIRLAAHDIESFQDYLIVSLYTLLPPARLDYGEMLIVTEEPTEHGANYLVLNDKPYFFFTEYKTYKKYGAQRAPLPPALAAIIQEWIELTDPAYLLSDASGGPLKDWSLGQKLISIFEKHAGKSVGANILRHSYDSWRHRGEMSFKESAELARQMGHSQQMSQLYRRLS